MAEVELQQIGNYAITELLRMSSTSNFYLGTYRKKNMLIKKLTIPLTAPEDKVAFLARTKQLTKLRDRSIVAIMDSGFAGDYGYIVMEPPAGDPLSKRIKPGSMLDPVSAKTYFSPLAIALHTAHLRKIIHGNLQPANILVDAQGVPLLNEFALTPPIPLSSQVKLEDEDAAIPYMAPEHLQGQPDYASDQYSLAVMLYEWLCGQRPYASSEREQLLHDQQHSPLPSLRTHNTKVSELTEQVILQALALKPEQRFPHMQAFSTAYLNALLGLAIKPTLTTTTTTTTIATTPASPRSSKKASPSKVPLSRALDELEQQTTQEQEELAPTTPTVLATPTIKPKRKKKVAAPSLKNAIQLQAPESPSTHSEEQQEAEHKVSETDAQVSAPVYTPGDTSHTVDEEKIKNFITDDMQDDEIGDEQATITNNSKLAIRVEEDLRQGGILSQSLPGYEERPAQIEMATLVSQAINRHVPAIIEAATGTGKSLAYLVPVVRSGQVAIISTANKALQEQLYYKDIPFVQKHIKHFDAALVKGVNNYICLDRVEAERVTWQLHTQNKEFQRFYDFLNDPEALLDFSGDFETLGFHLPADIRGKVATDSDQCAWTKCSFFEDCFVHQMRDRAERAQVIVVNHTLLLLDAAIGGFLLPERDMIILDEAHHLEEEATRSFTITITSAQILTLLAQRMLKDHSQMSLQDDTLRAAQVLWSRLEQMVMPSFKGRTNLDAPVEEGLRLATKLSDLTDSLRRQRPKDLPDKEGQLYDKLLKRAQNLSENVRTVFSVADSSKFVYYAERAEAGSRSNSVQASAAPLDVTTWLKERLFDKCNVISTSATLATVSPRASRTEEKGPNFSYFRRRIGLDPEERSDVMERILPLTFDYESNALLYLPRHLPAPAYGEGAEDYMTDIAREMYRLVRRSRGRAFLLFSSRRMLDYAYDLMAPHLDYPLLKQGDATRIELTRRFRAEEGAVLFGLKSFWEGVDIAGDALSLVVIDKLPFDPPDDPVHEARVAQMKAAGENWFGTYVLPQAVLRLKQGIGRLLRSRADRGVMAILDTRLHTKGYGRMVIDALPPARRTSNIQDVTRFFAEEE